MTAAELIVKLQQVPSDAEVLAWAIAIGDFDSARTVVFNKHLKCISVLPSTPAEMQNSLARAGAQHIVQVL